jgi:ribosomal-protein-alanine N-acetyltransferase
MPDEHELLNLAVAPEHRRKGIARTLLDYAKRQGPGLWFLEVRESNTAARTFYKSHGFIDFGKRKGYYQEPYEDAIVMRF